MQLSEMLDVLSNVSFPGFKFEIRGEANQASPAFYHFLLGTFRDHLSGELQTTRKWYLSPHATKSEIVQTALKCVLTASEHEAREHFTYCGRKVYGPHIDVEQLHAVCESLDVRPTPTDGASQETPHSTQSEAQSSQEVEPSSHKQGLDDAIHSLMNRWRSAEIYRAKAKVAESTWCRVLPKVIEHLEADYQRLQELKVLCLDDGSPSPNSDAELRRLRRASASEIKACRWVLSAERSGLLHRDLILMFLVKEHPHADVTMALQEGWKPKEFLDFMT